MSDYCTFFDRSYLAQGLALWRSVQRHEPEAIFWVLAADEETADVLRDIASQGIRVISLAELLAADPQLTAIQAGRARAEFIFTLKPCLCRYLLFEKPGIGLLTYFDSDLYFFDEPASIHRELAENSVFVVPHRYPAWHDDSAQYGRFNAGVLAFRNDATGRNCLDRWREQCLRSCGLRANSMTYGDQKYLDEWPDLYGSAICVSRNPGLNLAPWNWVSHACVAGSSGVRVDGGSLVAFHFAQFRRVSSRWFDSGQLEYGVMPLPLRSRIYGHYWNALLAAEAEIRAVRPGYSFPSRGWLASLGPWHLAVLRLFWGQFWLKLGPWWLAGRLGLGRFSGKVMGRYRRLQRRES
jgi:hypothetical protein